MISEIYERIVGNGFANLLREDEFESMEALRLECESRTTPTLIMVDAEQVDETISWLKDNQDICTSDTPESIIQHRLRKLAAPAHGVFDVLTGVLSRRSVERAIDMAGSLGDASQPLSLMLGDLDHFKRLNDTHGHAVGDQVLRTTAQVMRELCGEDDFVARFGGQVFAVFCARDRSTAAGLSERLRRAVEEWFAADINVTISVGTTTLLARDLSMLFPQADEALYAAKAGGRNRCVHFADVQSTSEQDDHHAELVGLENRARVLSERVANFISLRSKKLIKRIRSEADTDGLTQFYTRRYLDRRLKKELEESTCPMTVAFVDLDHFGQVNKQHGWPSGDKVLREVCDLIRQEIRESDWVGRYGGEEFCIVMRNTALFDAMVILERLRELVEATGFVSTTDERIEMTLSIGAIESIADQSHIKLLELASNLALQAKRAGRNRVCAD